MLDALRQLVRMLREASRESEQRAGLNAAQLFVLAQLRDGEALSINQLAVRTLTHQSSVSTVVQRLVDAGLVRRAEAANDRRRVEVTLTPEGKARLSRAPDVAQERILSAIAAMSEEDRAGLVRGLDALVEPLGLDETPPMLFAIDAPVRRKKPPTRRG